jgi:hypothetical protein
LAKQIPDDALAAIEEAVRRYPDGASAQEVLRALASQIPLRTLQYRLKSLVDRKRLVMDGEGRWARYRIPTLLPLSGQPTSLRGQRPKNLPFPCPRPGRLSSTMSSGRRKPASPSVTIASFSIAIARMSHST